MSIQESVNIVIQDWCGQAAPQDQNLKQLWDSTRNNPTRPHDGMDFQPDGAASLIGKLTPKFAFATGGDARRIVLVFTDFEPSGGVKTIDDLVRAVLFSPPTGTS